MLIDLAWKRKFQNLSTTHRWSKVVSLLDAIIATLLDYGWDPFESGIWVDPTGHAHYPTQPETHQTILDCFKKSATHYLQVQASRHPLGEGAQHGLDYQDFARHYKRLKTQDPIGAGRLFSIGQGSLWTPVRITDYTNFQCPMCGYCGCNWYHIVWACPWMNKQKHPHIQGTNHLYQFVRHIWTDHPTLWLRGIVASNHVHLTPPLTEQEATECFTFAGKLVFASTFGPVDLPEGAFGGTDGSGGEHSSDPLLRRCAFAFVVLSGAGELLLSIRGPLGGVSQTVPRAELIAFLLIIEHTTGYLPVCTDSKYVYNGFSKGPRHHHGYNKDLWARFWKTYSARNGICKLDWTPSHEDEGSLVSGAVLPWHWVANFIADKLASKTAADFQIDRDDWLEYEKLYNRASSVRRRLVAVHELWFSLNENQYVFHRDTARLQERELKRARVDADQSALDDPCSQISVLVSASRHKINRSTKLWTCTSCWTSADSRTSGLIPWLKGICFNTKPPWVDPTHDYCYQAPWHLCLRCGSHVNEEGILRYVNLASPCRQPYQTHWLISKGFIKNPSRL